MNNIETLFEKMDRLLDRFETLFVPNHVMPDWAASVAFRWRKRRDAGYLQPVAHLHQIRMQDLHAIDRQKAVIDANTKQFVNGMPANNVLLWGARGTGKSSLIKALLNEYANQGLRLIEVDKHDLVDMPDIVDLLYARPERFILFCDDLSFETNEPGYKALKVALDGSIATSPENVLIYATSNRRHLMPEYMEENLQARHIEGEIHQAEAVEEKISLSERFGLFLSFYPYNQDDYLGIVFHWLQQFRVPMRNKKHIRTAALQWALERGSRSGRVAWQFAKDFAGKTAMTTGKA